MKTLVDQYNEIANIARKLYPGIGGAILSAWVEGYLNLPQRGVRRYPKTSACQDFYNKGKAYKKGEKNGNQSLFTCL